MKAANRVKCILAVLVAATFPAYGGEIETLDDALFPAEEVDFYFGDHCDELEALSFEALLQLTVASDDRLRQRFCAVASRADCVDRQGGIQDFGTLLPSETVGYCRFVPKAVRRKADTLVF